MADLYLASYTASGVSANVASKDVVGGGTKDKDNETEWKRTPETETVESLLGGACNMIIEARCGFTAAVSERHGSRLLRMVPEVSSRLQKILLEVIKAYQRSLLPTNPAFASSFQDIKDALAVLMRANQSNPSITGFTCALTISDLYSILDQLSRNELLREAFPHK